MPTAVLYIFILVVSTIFVWLSGRGRASFDRQVLLGAAFLLVFVPSAIRYDIGTDYLSYIRIFEEISLLERYKLREPGFYFVNWSLRTIGAHAQWAIAIFALIFTVVAFQTYGVKNAWILHFIFFSMLWFFSFNGVRQAMALSFCMLALFKYLDGKYLKFFAITAVGALFHQSAIFMLLVGLMAMIPVPICVKERMIPLGSIFLLILIAMSLTLVVQYMEKTLYILGMTEYVKYFYNEKHFTARDFGTGLGVLFKLMFSLYILLNARSLLRECKQYWIVILLMIAYAIGIILANKIIIFGRMSYTFVIGPIVSGYLIIGLRRNRKLNKVVLIAFMIFLLLTFIKDSLSFQTSYSDPKLNPYQTIFNK